MYGELQMCLQKTWSYLSTCKDLQVRSVQNASKSNNLQKASGSAEVCGTTYTNTCWFMNMLAISIGVQMCLHMPREPPDVLTNLYGSTDVLHSLRHSGVFRNVQKAPHVEMHYYRTPDVFNNISTAAGVYQISIHLLMCFSTRPNMFV